jgi:hypothetical protein
MEMAGFDPVGAPVNLAQRTYRRFFVFAEKHWRSSWVLALIGALWWALATYNEEPWLSYRNLPFEVAIPVVRPGEVIPLRVKRCNAEKTPQIYSIARTLENVRTGRQYVMPDSIVQLKPGCTEAISLANVVPPDVPFGRYKLNGLSQVQSSFRIHFIGWTSHEFEVITGDAR